MPNVVRDLLVGLLFLGAAVSVFVFGSSDDMLFRTNRRRAFVPSWRSASMSPLGSSGELRWIRRTATSRWACLPAPPQRNEVS